MIEFEARLMTQNGVVLVGRVLVARLLWMSALSSCLVWTSAARAQSTCLVGPQAVAAPSIEMALREPELSDLGPLGEDVLAQVLAHLCAEQTVRQALPGTCNAEGAATLQRALVKDVLQIPKHTWAHEFKRLSAEARLAMELLAAMAGDFEPAALTQELAFRMGYAQATACSIPVARLQDPLSVMLLASWTVSQRYEQNGAPTEGVLTAALIERLRSISDGHPEEYFAAADVRAVATKGVALHAAYAAFAQKPGKAGILLVLQRYVEVLETSIALTRTSIVGRLRGVEAALEGIITANWASFTAALTQMLGAEAKLDSDVLTTVQNLTELLRAKGQDQAQSIVRRLLFGLGPWSDKWLIAVNANYPKLQSNNVNIVGEGQLGYNGGTWGLVAAGGARVVEYEAPDSFTSGGTFFGSADGWFGWELTPQTQVEVRATVEALVLDDERSVNDLEAGAAIVGQEDRFLFRGGGLLGVRHQRKHFAVGLWLGGSRQLESYDVLTTIVGDEVTSQGQNLTASSNAASGRLRLQWAFVPGYLSLRLTGDARYYSLSRFTEDIDTSEDEPLIRIDTEASQLDTSGRAFVALDRLRLFEFVPEVGAGLDFLRLTSRGQQPVDALIPVFFAGIRRTTF